MDGYYMIILNFVLYIFFIMHQLLSVTNTWLIFQTLPFHPSPNLPLTSPVVSRFNFRSQTTCMVIQAWMKFQPLVRLNMLISTPPTAAPTSFHWVRQLSSVIVRTLNWQIERCWLKGEGQKALPRTQGGWTW